MKLAAVTFQNLFPAINVQTTRLSACQVRVTQGSAGGGYALASEGRACAAAAEVACCAQGACCARLLGRSTEQSS